MKSRFLNIWKKLTRYTQGLILIMVAALFFSWGLLGQRQVQNQNEAIASAIEEQHAELQRHIDVNIDVLLSQARFTTCILKTLPQDRTPKVVNECLKTSGLKELV